MPGPAKETPALLLAKEAEAFSVSVLTQSHSTLIVSVPLQRSSGQLAPYILRIEASGAEPQAYEQTPERLPTFCPDRHIDGGGRFCMGFSKADPLPVVDAVSARAWWARLLKFLNLQETTSKLRRWPTGNEWGHGIAASFQDFAERSAAALGQRFADALRRGELNVKRRGASSRFIELRQGTTKLYSVWAEESRVATLRQTCVCGSGKVLIACGNHAQWAAILPEAILEWRKAEKNYWKALRGHPCCGTLRDCPLRVDQPKADIHPISDAKAA